MHEWSNKCRSGRNERKVVGFRTASEAVSNWQRRLPTVTAYFVASPPSTITFSTTPAAGTPERGSRLVFGRLEAGDALLEGRKLDHDEAVEVVRALVDRVAAAARENLAAMLGDDRRHKVRWYFLYCTGSVIFARATQ